MTFIDCVGYLASFFVVLSLAMKNIVYLRVLNMTGAVLFCVYGILTHTYPVVAANTILIGINIYHLINRKKAP